MRTLKFSAPVGRRPLLARVAASSVLTLVASAVLGHSPAGAVVPTADPAPAPGVSDVRIGLVHLGAALASAAKQPALSEDLPLTDTSVSDLLALDTVVGTLVDDALENKNDVTLDTLAGAFTDPALKVSEVTPSPVPADQPREWDLKLSLKAARKVALAYQDTQLQFGSAELHGELAAALTGTIRFRYDPKAEALRTFSVVGDSALTTHVWSRDNHTDTTGQQVDIDPFKLVDGFVQLDASGTATVDTSTVLMLRDPNGRGSITTEDFEFSSADELFATTTPPGDDSVHVDLGLSTTMDPDATGTIKVGTRSPGAKTVYAAPVVARTAPLASLSSLTRLQAISGFTQYTSALQGAEGSVNQALPLLDLSLTDLYSPADRLQSLLTEQATATVVCGAANTSPPSGAPRPGQVRYCQAVTPNGDPLSGKKILWSSPDPDVTISPDDSTDAPGTVGKAPTKNVVVSGGDGFPTLRVQFTDQNGAVQHARSAVTSIQQLARAIAKLGLSGDVSYDHAKRALEIGVHQSISSADADADSRSVATGGNGNLAPLTGLTGLCQAAVLAGPRQCQQTGEKPDGTSYPAPQEGSATVTTFDRTFAADFGIGLADPGAGLTEDAAPPADPTFYVLPGTDGVVYQVGKVTATLPDQAKLVARIGFLQVDVDVTSYALDQDADKKAASVSVPTSTVTLPSGEERTGAVLVGSLLGDAASPTVTPAVERGLSAKATLSVQASQQDEKDGNGNYLRPLSATGTVNATWGSLLPDALPTVETGGDYDQLRLLDLVPARQGTMGPSTTGTTISDPTADFYTQFGVSGSTPDAERVVTRPLYDLGVTGSSSTICTKLFVVSKTALRCDQGPLATAGKVAPGHPYAVDGDPDALRNVLIGDLAAVQNSFVAPRAALNADRTFPLVDVLPTEISAARDGIGTALKKLQAQVVSTTPGTSAKTATMQGFTSTLDSFLGTAVTGDAQDSRKLTFTLVPGSGSTPSRLVLEAGMATSGHRDAPLRVTAGSSEVRVRDGDPIVTLPVKVGSTATYVIGVNLEDATSAVRGDTGVTEQISGFTGDVASVKNALANKTTEYGSATVKSGPASGIDVGISVGATTRPAGSSTAWTPLTGLADALEQKRDKVGAAQTCGHPADADKPDIAACLDLPLVAASDPNLAPVAVALKGDQSSGGSGGSMKVQPISYRFLTDALGGLNLTLADSLDGDQSLSSDGTPLSLPLIGTDLDGGVQVPEDIKQYVAAARKALTPVESAVPENSPTTDLSTALQAALDVAKDDASVSGRHVTATNGAIVLTCATPPCSGKTVADVQQIEVPITLKGTSNGEVQTTFQAGPAGSTIVSNRKVPTTTTWTLNVTVGIARGTGPFVKLGVATAADPLLEVKVESHLAKDNGSTNTCHARSQYSNWKSKVDPLPGDVPQKYIDVADDPECLDAFVGKFPSVLADRAPKTPGPDGNRGTYLKATITVAVPAPAGATDGIVYLPTLFDKRVSFTTTPSGSGALAVYFQSFASDAGFFDVMGTIDLAWTGAGYSSDGLQFGRLKLDLTTLNDAILPGFDKAKKYLAPFNPVVDTLTRPIPVVSDLSQLVGQGPVSLLTLLQTSGNPKIQLILNLLQLQNMIAGGPSDTSETHDLRTIGETTGSGAIGGFKVKPSQIDRKSCTETLTDKNNNTSTRTYKGDGASGTCTPDDKKEKKQKEKDDEDLPDGKKIDKASTTNTYYSLPSVSVPVLQDTKEVFGLLLDTGDATLLYVDLGHAGVSKQVVKKFGPFAVGPVPVTATIGGTAKLDGRFAFGFDTRGLSRQINSLDAGDISGFNQLTAGGAKPSLFSDGFYIDDLEDGVDVPEISLTFTIQAGAAVSIGFAEAGITGGVTLDIALDANDPNGDGKIYSDEFAGSSSGPSCAFNVSSGIEFFLQFYFSIDLLFYTIEKSFDIYRSPRLKIFEFTCDNKTPVLATKVAADGDKPPKLVLTMGPEATKRQAFDGVAQEKYTVRQLGPPKADNTVDYQVSAFNLTQNVNVPKDTVITADGGAGGDTIRMYPEPVLSADSQNQPVLKVPGDPGYVAPVFTGKADITGGPGDDIIETSDNDDTINGDGGADTSSEGNDTIRSGRGDDTVNGGGGTDQIDGGEGQDVLKGGSGDDRINGGPGADVVRGEAGDDTLDGGIGASPDMLFPTVDAATIKPLLDSGDLVVGGDGADSVTGGDGSDVVVGGQYDQAAAFADTGSASVFGLNSQNKITKVSLTAMRTVTLPDQSVLDDQCATSGAAGEVGPDVVTGGGDRDYVIGGAGSDTLSGGGGNDVVCGRGGDDVLDGDGTDVDVKLQGDDVVRGGPGRDRIYGSAGKDTLYGDAGDDLIRGGTGDDTLVGGADSDLLLGEAGLDDVVGDGAGASDAVSPVTADTTATGRRIICSATTSVVAGGIDLDGDLAGNDTGELEGINVVSGRLQTASGKNFNGVVNGVVFLDGQADLDGNGKIEARSGSKINDTGAIPLAGITGATGNGDCILGGDGVDTRLDGGVGGDYVDAGAGDDTKVYGGSGNDLVRGGEGDDLVHGDAGNDLVAGDGGNDTGFGDAGDDVLRGGSGNDLLAGGSSQAGATDGADEVLGDGGDDVVLGGNATLSRTAPEDTAIPGVGITLLATTSADGPDDKVYGGYGDDWVFGQGGDDETYGGPGTDVVEGGPGNDRVQGDDDDDLLIGGSSTTGAVTTTRTAVGVEDGNDEVVGDEGVDSRPGSDVMVGDNARLRIVPGSDRARWNRIRPDVEVELFDVATDAAGTAAANGNDTMRGGGDDDLILGQGGRDTISGGDGADGIEGNAGRDVVHGDAGDDEILGGSWTAATFDGTDGDQIFGDDGSDVLLGDNGNPVTSGSPYVHLLDAPAAGATASAAYFAGDQLNGGAGDDQLFGQGGNDTLNGDAGVDLLEGDAGADHLFGGTDDDVLTGGSSSGDGVISPTRTAGGQLDADDTLSGGSGDDVLAGDNARLISTSKRRTDGTRLRSVLLFDVATSTTSVPAGVGAADKLSGDDGRDLVFGQAGDDAELGNAGDDYLEGNVGNDTLEGGAGEDDVIGGGSSRTGAIITVNGSTVDDRLLAPLPRATDDSAATQTDGNDIAYGGDASDVILGDNGRITRTGPAKTISGGASGPHVVRQVAMADQAPGTWSGSDELHGDLGDDELYGQFDNTSTKRPQLTYLGAPVPGDVLIGGGGDDAFVADQGIDVPTPAASLGATNRVVTDSKGFLHELVRPIGTLVRVVTLTQSTIGGDDLVLGEDGADSIHAGAGRDTVNAGAGNDVVFGGDGADALWGGADHDRVFGGSGNDLLDIKRRTADPRLWQVAAPVQDTDRLRRTLNGRDVLYGGSGADALQADQGDEGTLLRAQGDRLIDWYSAINYYKTCQGGYGPGKISNVASSSMTSTLRLLATATGAVGSTEVAIPGSERATAYPGTATFLCETR